MITLTDAEAKSIVAAIGEHGRLAAAAAVETFFAKKKQAAIAADFEPDTDQTIAESYHNGG